MKLKRNKTFLGGSLVPPRPKSKNCGTTYDPDSEAVITSTATTNTDDSIDAVPCNLILCRIFILLNSYFNSMSKS